MYCENKFDKLEKSSLGVSLGTYGIAGIGSYNIILDSNVYGNLGVSALGKSLVS